MLPKITGRAQFRLALLTGKYQSTSYVVTISRAAFLKAERSSFQWAQPSWIDACSCFWCCLCCHTTSVFQGMPKGIYRCQELRGRNTVVSPWCCRRQCLPFFTPSFPRKPPGYGSPDTSLSLSPGYKTVSKQPQERRWGLWWCQCSSLDAHSTMNDLRKTVRSMGVSLTSNFQQKYRSLNSRKTEAWGLAAQRTGAKLVEGKPNQTKKASRK